MNRNTILQMCLVTMLCSLFNSCVTDPTPIAVATGTFGAHAVFIVNEGSGHGDASLDYYQPDSGTYYSDFFHNANPTAVLGEFANDIIVCGKDSLLVLVNGLDSLWLISGKTGKLLRTYSLPTKCSAEKLVMLNDSEAIITSARAPAPVLLEQGIWHGSTGIDATLKIGAFPINIARLRNTIFVSANGGSEIDIIQYPASTSSVMNVGAAPATIVIRDDTSAAVICSAYGTSDAKVYFFNPTTFMITRTTSVPGNPSKMALDGNLLYVALDSSVIRLDFTQPMLRDTFISAAAHIAPYGIAVDNVTHSVYLSDAKGFSQRGSLTVFDNAKHLITQQATGIAPGTMLITH